MTDETKAKIEAFAKLMGREGAIVSTRRWKEQCDGWGLPYKVDRDKALRVYMRAYETAYRAARAG